MSTCDLLLVQVPLGVLLKNENKADDMVEIMSHLHQYVPATEHTKTVFVPSTGEMVQVKHAVFNKIFVEGDQLTVVRARGSQNVMDNSISPSFRMHGLIPCIEDWHTKLSLLGVSKSCEMYQVTHKTLSD